MATSRQRFISPKRLTPLVQEAVSTLTRLADDESVDTAHRASCVVLADRMTFPGWKRATGTVCWRRVVGKRCGQSSRPYRCDYYPPGTDHPSLWRVSNGDLVYVSHPYDLSAKELREMVGFGEKNGLTFTIRGNSWYYPGATVLVVWRKLGERED